VLLASKYEGMLIDEILARLALLLGGRVCRQRVPADRFASAVPVSSACTVQQETR
jgi:hypothetical protein